MKLNRTLAALASLSCMALPLSSHAADIGFALTIDDATNTVSTTLAGATITTLGAQRWSIDLSGTAITAFQTFGDAANLSWTNGDDPGVNWLRWQSGGTYLLEGDTTDPAALAGNCGISAPLLEGVTCFIGRNTADRFFVTVLDATTAAVPVPATLALAGLGLLAAAGASRRRG